MGQKKLDYSLLLFVIIVSSLMAIMMKSVVFLYNDDTYNPNFYIYQVVLYLVAGFVVVINRHIIQKDTLLEFMLVFGIMCFLFSFVQLRAFNLRSVGALFFNTFIIPLAYLNGSWLGNRLSYLKDRDLYLLLLQIPAFYSMYLLYGYNSLGNWFDADAAFCVIVFFPFVFYFKREWLSVIFAIFYVAFTLTSAKRSILLFVIVCIAFFAFYIIRSRNQSRQNVFSRLFVLLAIIAGSYFILTNESSGLIHTQERIEGFGGITFDNGRYDIYSIVSLAIINSDVVPLFFGHGHSAVKRDFDIGAHNDLLEIAYDYGLIAMILYICILLVIIKRTWRLFKHRNYLSTMRVGICVASIIILGMLNCIITSTVLEYIMFLALGCAMGMDEMQVSQNQVKLNAK